MLHFCTGSRTPFTKSKYTPEEVVCESGAAPRFKGLLVLRHYNQQSGSNDMLLEHLSFFRYEGARSLVRAVTNRLMALGIPGPCSSLFGGEVGLPLLLPQKMGTVGASITTCIIDPYSKESYRLISLPRKHTRQRLRSKHGAILLRVTARGLVPWGA